MKTSYWKNLYASRVSNEEPLKVLEESLKKLEDLEILNKVIKCTRCEDLVNLLELLKHTTYNLNESVLISHILKFPLRKSTFISLKSLNITASTEICKELLENAINYDDYDFLLNYCFIRESLENYEHFELFRAVDLSTLFSKQQSNNTIYCDKEFANNRYFHLLKKMLLSLRMGFIKSYNIESIRKWNEHSESLRDMGEQEDLNKKLVLLLKNTIQDPLLLAIIDENGRVNGTEYLPDDLVLISVNQVYNIKEPNKGLLMLCQENSADFKCQYCKRACFSTNNKTLLPETARGNSISSSSSFKIEVIKYLDHAIVEGNIKIIHSILLHRPAFRAAKYLKIILKLYIADSTGYFKKKRDKEVDKKQVLLFNCVFLEEEDLLAPFLDTFSLFEMNEENEAVVISFFKAAEAYLAGALKAIPCFLRSKRLYFAAFIVLLKAAKTSAFLKLITKNLIYRFSTEFSSIVDLLLEYYIKMELKEADNEYDNDFLNKKLSSLADLFSQSTEAFISKNIYYIFNSFYPSTAFTKTFVESHVKFVVTQQILDGSYVDSVDDVDVLVGLLFQNHFINLDQLFKPSAALFVKKNLSHILFKIKNAYSVQLYNRKTCIYKIMTYVLSHVNLGLYFSYVWPYVEFFLNREYCECAEHFLAWLRTFQDSKLFCPYLLTPFEKIDDLPRLPNLETKIYEMLARFFSIEKKPFRIAGCISTGSKEGLQAHNENILNPLREKIKYNNAVFGLYENIKGCMPHYSPISLINDQLFIEKFVHFYRKNKCFRLKINSLHATLPLETKALFGDLKYDSVASSLPKAPKNIPKAILEKFLLKINYEQQDLFAFTIQEFLKSINEDFEPEIENFVQQFRHTKFEYKFSLMPVSHIDFSSYRSFLESIFSILYIKIKKNQFLKYLILFDDPTIEYACLCMIKIISDESDEDDFVLLNNAITSNIEILGFLLKVNAFVGKEVVKRDAFLNYAIRSRDFYSIIYCLESTSTDLELLQISYFMIDDYVRVKGFNTASLQNNYSILNLFFDFIISKNYKAAQQCLQEILTTPGNHNAFNSILSSKYKKRKQLSYDSSFCTRTHNKSFDQLLENLEGFSITPKQEFISKILKKILECNEQETAETILQGKDDGMILHVLKDLELLMTSDDIKKTIDVIVDRREISKSPELILKVHKLVEGKLGIPSFSRAVDEDMIKLLMSRKEYQKAEEEIARMILKREYTVLYDHALIKIDQKRYDEAKELLKRAKQLCNKQSLQYFKATTKICEISPGRGNFEEGVEDLENVFKEMIGEEENKTTKLVGLYEKLSKMNCSFTNKAENRYSQKGEQKELFEFYKQMQKLYFLTAKYFEKYDSLVSIKYYFKSFTWNHESIPRFFHLIANVARVNLKVINEMIGTIKKEYLPNLIPFYNQISTKIALEGDSVKFYKEIVAAMLESHPYETHWKSLFLYNSKKAGVSKIMEETVEQLSLERRRLFLDIKNCSEKFASIAKSNATKMTMEDFPEIRNLFPAQVNIPGKMTEINNIKNEIFVFRSLQMPKKITLFGEDGIEYPMIVKFKDDLRKDSRFMDLDELLNKLFDEGYYIRKYNVIPFNHESGIIEFVPNLCNMKDIVQTYHTIPAEVLQKFLRTKMIGGNNMQALMDKFRPVYNKYLKETYTDPYSFYQCRENYIRTYAIMNVVGWFMGLGDRHTENIHFDKHTGDTVHVDLNCIFDKGKSLEIPEKVPFRLTQNIIDGFGVLKLEGTYKHTLKYTLELLRNNRDVVQANLLSFVFDPLFEWARRKTEPSKIIEVLNKKLDFDDVDFKVDELITEATSMDNLGSMYIGWMAFI
ncbi:hypothetical protein GINT2_000713 [Glugoides intestinalis]